MFKHNLLIILRSFNRSRSNFLINLAGLSTGLACTLLIYLWINDELSINRFNTSRQVYQVLENNNNTDQVITQEYTPDLLASTMAEEFPEVKLATSVLPSSQIPWPFTVTANTDKHINSFKIKGQFAGKDFFKIFSYPLLSGNANTVLQDKNDVVISEDMALKLFNTTQDVIGKSINWQLGDFKGLATIAGVFKTLPKTSSEQFDICFTHELFMDPGLFHRTINWDNHAPSTYLLLKPGTNTTAFNSKIKGYLKSKLSSSRIDLLIRPFADSYLYNKYENGVQAGGKIETVKLIGIVGCFILLIACINFINLSTARASTRLKEIGVKKTLGAGRKILLVQYLSESVLLAFISFIVALVMVILLLPVFNNITGKELTLVPDVKMIIAFVSIILVTGLLSGFYPAVYLSGFNPIVIFKGKISHSFGEIFARKGLVVFQFVLSVMLILAVAVVYQQIQFVQKKNLGFDKDHVLYITTDGSISSHMKAFIDGLKEINGVENAASIEQSLLSAGQGHTSGLNWPGKPADALIRFTNITVGYNAIETMGMAIKEGRPFNIDYPTDSNTIIFNEAAINVMQLKDPVGKKVELWGEPRTIVGVVKDFNYSSLRDKVEPAFLKIGLQDARQIIVSIKGGNEKETLAGIKKLYASFNPGYSFDYRFLDDDFQAQYINEQRISLLSRYFAGLAIIISCLGLLGLSAFTAERRRKEIGIRKVLGASESGIVALLSKDFLMLVGLAIIIALPAAWFGMHKWLETFYYHTTINAALFVVVALLVLVIAFVTISAQSIKAATANPVTSLRSE